jgi:uncharacterized protein (DUF1015 family)
VVTVRPVRRAILPVDTEAAQRLSFPGDGEFPADIPDEALEEAAESLARLEESPLTRTTEGVLLVYEIVDPRRGGARQIGLGGMAVAGEIRTRERPRGTIVRNEGIREGAARGQARLIRRTGACIGMVQLAVEDLDGRLEVVLRARADAGPEQFHATDGRGCIHRIWVEDDPGTIRYLAATLAREPRAYVADGNHRTAAAAALGLDGFLAVFFPARTLGLAPCNRLVRAPRRPLREILPAVERGFRVEALPGVDAFQPSVTHEIGLYGVDGWHRLTPRTGIFDGASPVETVDAVIVQRRLFDEVLGIHDDRDGRLRFVGGNRSASYLRRCVDGGEYAYAVTLPPVTVEQFLQVCRQGRLLPPKSTCFQPKVLSGLVVALARTPAAAGAAGATGAAGGW